MVQDQYRRVICFIIVGVYARLLFLGRRDLGVVATHQEDRYFEYEITLDDSNGNRIPFHLNVSHSTDFLIEAKKFFEDIHNIDPDLSTKICGNLTVFSCLQNFGILQDVENRLSLDELERTGYALGEVTRLDNFAAPCYVAENGSSFCGPSVVVAGMPKAGTTALHFALASHARFRGAFISRQSRAPVQKEYCPCFTPDQARPYARIAVGTTRVRGGTCYPVQWLSHLPQPADRDQLTLSGCILDPMQYANILKELRTETKFLVCVRNYADWAYSAFMFWCRPGFDANCPAHGRHIKPEYHYRSPTLFEEIVTASDTGKGPSAWPEIGPKLSIFRTRVKFLWRSFGQSNVKIIQSEMLLLDPGKTLTEVAEFLNIDAEDFEEHMLMRPMYVNPASYKGLTSAAIKKIQEEEKQNVSLNRVFRPAYAEMTSKSRKILNDFWHDECIWLSQQCGIHYKSCVTTIEKKDEGNIAAVVVQFSHTS